MWLFHVAVRLFNLGKGVGLGTGGGLYSWSKIMQSVYAGNSINPDTAKLM